MGLAAAAGAGLAPVKVNPVLMRGVNDDQAAELLRFCGSPVCAREAVRHGSAFEPVLGSLRVAWFNAGRKRASSSTV